MLLAFRPCVYSGPSFFRGSPISARTLLIVAHRGLHGLPRIMLDRLNCTTKTIAVRETVRQGSVDSVREITECGTKYRLA
jgi:hypothetical protein